ncbi:hypothetical protein BD309DRAFT_961935 [Dichomitus squalens]|nr:hypothetical protein BD309DRAFT_961935 [Dichomitus squalens]
MRSQRIPRLSRLRTDMDVFADFRLRRLAPSAGGHNERPCGRPIGGSTPTVKS